IIPGGIQPDFLTEDAITNMVVIFVAHLPPEDPRFLAIGSHQFTGVSVDSRQVAFVSEVSFLMHTGPISNQHFNPMLGVQASKYLFRSMEVLLIFDGKIINSNGANPHLSQSSAVPVTT